MLTLVNINVNIHAHSHTHLRSRAHTCTCTHTHKHKHTHLHTQTQVKGSRRLSGIGISSPDLPAGDENGAWTEDDRLGVRGISTCIPLKLFWPCALPELHSVCAFVPFTFFARPSILSVRHGKGATWHWKIWSSFHSFRSCEECLPLPAYFSPYKHSAPKWLLFLN
jgi:hypothetical protein